MSRRKKIWTGVGVAAVLLGIPFFYFYGGALKLLFSGKFNQSIFKPAKVEYAASNEANLKAIRTALMLYHDNEEQFPTAAGWMDAVKSQLRTNDLKEGEELKKLHVPGSTGEEYGYALNAAAAGKYKGDLKPTTVLVFESNDKKWNAAGDPAKDGKGLGITVEGKLEKVP